MYNALTPLFNHVTTADLFSDFKPEALGSAVTGPGSPEQVPPPGRDDPARRVQRPARLRRTRDDVTWGAGWVVAEDRGLLLQQARDISLLAAIDAPGLSAINLIGNLATFTPTAQTEARWPSRRTRCSPPAPRDGRSCTTSTSTSQGINAYFTAHGSTAPPFTRNDIYAFNALKDQFVGEGGGQQAVNSEFLAALQQQARQHKGHGGLERPPRGERPRGAGQRARPRRAPAAAEEHRAAT